MSDNEVLESCFKQEMKQCDGIASSRDSNYELLVSDQGKLTLHLYCQRGD